MSNIIIIGSGPAGISAALYTKRSGIDTTVISMGEGSLAKAHLIENYYGAGEPVSGSDLHKRGIEQAKTLGVNFVEDEVVGITFENKLTVTCPTASYEADAVIIATGQKRTAPKIKGLADFEGTGVSYCATCDGFFHRGKDTVVFGNGLFAQHEAEYLANMCNSVTILTDNQEPTFPVDKLPEKVTVNSWTIRTLRLFGSAVKEVVSCTKLTTCRNTSARNWKRKPRTA
jgi:thioredoxin reductase (NADPH)